MFKHRSKKKCGDCVRRKQAVAVLVYKKLRALQLPSELLRNQSRQLYRSTVAATEMSSAMVATPLKAENFHDLIKVEDQLRVDDDTLKPMLPGRRSNRNRVIYKTSSTVGRHPNRKYSDDICRQGAPL